MKQWLDDLENDLKSLKEHGVLRQLRQADSSQRVIHIAEQSFINLAGNDYLALAGHPRLCQAAIEAIKQYGAGSGASRLVSGHCSYHVKTEQYFARFKKSEAALLCPTGYMANLAVLTTLASEGDLICLDKLCHASLIDAARSSSAQVRTYPHNTIHKLERLLKRHCEQTTTSDNKRLARRFIVTDTVFSMDGDTANLPELCDLAERYDAITIVDEAHGTGLLGEHGGGLCELQNVCNRVDVVVSTASKALGGLGGIITARQIVVDSIINHARSFIYTTAIPPAQAAVISAALDVIRDEPWRRKRVLQLASVLNDQLKSVLPAPIAKDIDTPIIPIIVGEAQAAVELSTHLQNQGFFAPAIRPPTVAPGASRIRISLRADHEDEDIERLYDTLASWFSKK